MRWLPAWGVGPAQARTMQPDDLNRWLTLGANLASLPALCFLPSSFGRTMSCSRPMPGSNGCNRVGTVGSALPGTGLSPGRSTRRKLARCWKVRAAYGRCRVHANTDRDGVVVPGVPGRVAGTVVHARRADKNISGHRDRPGNPEPAQVRARSGFRGLGREERSVGVAAEAGDGRFEPAPELDPPPQPES